MVNGEPKLTCATFVAEYAPGPVRIEPLKNFPIIRDLTIEMSDFMTKLKNVKPWIIRKNDKPVEEGDLGFCLCHIGQHLTGAHSQFSRRRPTFGASTGAVPFGGSDRVARRRKASAARASGASTAAQTHTAEGVDEVGYAAQVSEAS